MEVVEAIRARRSCRAYESREVSEEDLKAVLEAAAWAPSAMNSQCWHFTAVVNEAKLSELNDAILARMDGAARERAASRADGKRVSPFYNAPALIIVALKDGGSVYPEADAACALENAFLAATSLGLGSCWINQLRGANTLDPHAGKILSELGVPSGYTVYGCCALGYPESSSAPKARAAGTVNIVK